MPATTGFPEWRGEYFRLLRREKYTYERDAKYRLLYVDEPAAIPDGVDMAERIVDRLAVEQALGGLDDGERDLLHDVYYERMTLAAIARRDGVAYRTLGCRLDRTLRKARRTLNTAVTASQSRLPGGAK